MGVSKKDASSLRKLLNLGLNESVAFAAYNIGRKNMLQLSANGGIINIKNAEAQNGESIHLRDGGKRDGSENPEGELSQVESGTRQAEAREGKSRKVADDKAANLANEGREVKVSELGIAGGSKEQTVRLVDKESETSSMKKARKLAEKRGLKVKFFAGDNLVIKSKNGEWISARGYITGDYVFVRADHPLYTSDQLMRHEVGHDMIAKGEIDINEVRERILTLVDKENLDIISGYYADAYVESGLNEQQIWEECICDSLADMNVFAEINKLQNIPEANVLIEQVLSKLKTFAEAKPKHEAKVDKNTETNNEAGRQTRGAPEKVLYNKRDGKNGWGKYYSNPLFAVKDAVKIIDENLYNAFDKEVNESVERGARNPSDENVYTPTIDAFIAVNEDVRQETITPIQGAKLLSEAYAKKGVKGLESIYNHATGNLYPQALARAKQYSTSADEVTEGKASRETGKSQSEERKTMENNRFARLRKFHNDLPDFWFAYSYDNFYVYRNQSYTDYKIIKKIPINETNSQLITEIERRLKDDANPDTRTVDGWIKSFRSRERLDHRHNDNAYRGRTTGTADGVDGGARRGETGGHSSEGNGNSRGKFSRELDLDYMSAVNSGDRVGNVLLPERAASGPVAFFTDNKDRQGKKQ